MRQQPERLVERAARLRAKARPPAVPLVVVLQQSAISSTTGANLQVAKAAAGGKAAMTGASRKVGKVAIVRRAAVGKVAMVQVAVVVAVNQHGAVALAAKLLGLALEVDGVPLLGAPLLGAALEVDGAEAKTTAGVLAKAEAKMPGAKMPGAIPPRARLQARTPARARAKMPERARARELAKALARAMGRAAQKAPAGEVLA